MQILICWMQKKVYADYVLKNQIVPREDIALHEQEHFLYHIQLLSKNIGLNEILIYLKEFLTDKNELLNKQNLAWKEKNKIWKENYKELLKPSKKKKHKEIGIAIESEKFTEKNDFSDLNKKLNQKQNLNESENPNPKKKIKKEQHEKRIFEIK